MGSPGNTFEETDRDLASRGFKLIESVHDENAFGSRYAIYSRGAESVRLTWDKRDEWLLLEIRKTSAESWRDLCIEKIGRKTASADNIAALRAALQSSSIR